MTYELWLEQLYSYRIDDTAHSKETDLFMNQVYAQNDAKLTPAQFDNLVECKNY